jgi:hypothetical protein
MRFPRPGGAAEISPGQGLGLAEERTPRALEGRQELSPRRQTA